MNDNGQEAAHEPARPAGRVRFADVHTHANMHNARLLVLAETAVDDTLLDAGIALSYDPATAEAAFLVKRTSVEYVAPPRYRDHAAAPDTPELPWN